MIKFKNGNIVTEHFDISNNACLLNLPTKKGWQLRYYENHKLKYVENWNFKFASIRDMGETIQGTYKAPKKRC